MSWNFTIRDVLDVCGVSCTRVSRKGEVRVACPRAVTNSKGKTAMFDVNLEKNNFKCFMECEGCVSKGGMLDLYNLLMDRTFDDRKGARKEIIERLGSNQPAQPHHCAQEPARHSEPKKNDDALDKAYRLFLSKLSLYEKHRRNLLDRGLTARYIDLGLYRSIPEGKERTAVLKELKRSGLFDTNIPGFYTDKQNKLQIAAFASGFFVPYFNAEGKITGLQIRYDEPKEGYPKYVWFSSIGYHGGCAAYNSAFYGIPGHSEPTTSSAVYVTEGALKAAISTCLDKNHHLFVAIAGVNCYAQWQEICRYLKKKNVRIVIDAFDNDRTTNEHVERALKRLYSIAEENGIQMQHLTWDNAYKGIDDFLLAATKRKKAKSFFFPPKQRRMNNGQK